MYTIKKVVIVRNKDDNPKFTVRLSQELAQAINIYCETIEMKPEQFIKDAIVKDLMRTYVVLQPENYICLGDKFPEVKKPLNMCFEVMRLMIEHNSK